MKSLIVLLVLSSNQVIAQSSDQVSKVIKSCISNKDWASVSCNYTSNKDIIYDQSENDLASASKSKIKQLVDDLDAAEFEDSNVQRSKDTFVSFIRKASKGIQSSWNSNEVKKVRSEMNDGLQKFLKTKEGQELLSYKKEVWESLEEIKGDGKLEDAGLNIMTQIADALKEESSRSKLNECQKACLAKCASSSLLRYDLDVAYLSRNEEAITSGVGVCRHYAFSFDHLAKELGLESKYLSSVKGKHAFGGVVIDGQDYFLEPQHSSCDFFNFE